jgi:hypothetical protein
MKALIIDKGWIAVSSNPHRGRDGPDGAVTTKLVAQLQI